jgi:hypothetical protein
MHRDRFVRVKKDGPPSDFNSVDELMIYGASHTFGDIRVGQVDHFGNDHEFAWVDDLYPDPYTIKRVRGCWITYNGSLDGGGVIPAPRNYVLDQNSILHRKMFSGGIVRMQFYHFAGESLFVYARMIITKVGAVSVQKACEVTSIIGFEIPDSTITNMSWNVATFQDGATFWSSGDPTKIIIPEDGIYICNGWIRWSFVSD